MTTINQVLNAVNKILAGPGGSGVKPTCVIILGMAGSGKTTFVQRLASHLHTR